MRCYLLALPLLTVLLFAGCAKPSIDDFELTTVTLPHGKKIRAEVMVKQEDMMRGMMFRDTAPPDRGMLFLHGKEGLNPYWMYQVKVPLDIIWMNRDHNVVEISANTPPCTSQSAKLCPTFGGTKPAIFVLELAGGWAAKYGIGLGDHIDF